MSLLVQLSSTNPFERSPEQRSNGPTMTAFPDTSTSPRSNRGDQSQVTSPANMGPPPNSSPPDSEHNGHLSQNHKEQGGPQSGAGAVANAQSKVVQTAFIHKLYSMLEDQSIRHLISWSNTNDSFVMSPSNEFSKVLAQYFKHTNISSFVRQLNMYGFHKVSDVFHTGSPESALWEFRHGNGSFRKGDLMGLRDIKRRASRHTLIHRDSFTNPNPNPNPKPAPSQPGTPQQEAMPDTDQRIAHLEYMLHDFHGRLNRTEDNYALMSSRCQALAEALVRCHQWIHGVAGAITSLGGHDQTLRNELSSMQQEVTRQLELVRSLEQPPPEVNGTSRQYYPTNMALDPPVSPRGYGFSESRRSSIQMSEPPPFGSRPPVPPIPPQFTSPRRFGSIGGPQSSPGFSKPPLPQPQQPHPLSHVVSPPPSLARRHTSADIREHGWPLPAPNNNNNSNNNHNNGGGGHSPYASGQSSVQWQPSSPTQPPSAADQHIQDQLASYTLNGGRRGTVTTINDSVAPHAEAPPLAPASTAPPENTPWPLSGSKLPRPNFELHSAPATRRSSMASNVHSLLNPADTMERPHEDEGRHENRKRTRLE